MKKLLLVSALFLFALIFSPLFSEANAACFPVNENTGVCDAGVGCSPDFTLCCTSSSECPATAPAPAPANQDQEATNPTCKNGQGINTAIGCIPITDTNLFIGFILRWAIGIGGGIAFLLIVSAAFTIMTSQGNPERLKAGQELLTSAIAGLIMLIFSVFILRVIGVDILKLPGF